MAFGKGQESTEGVSRKLYTGVASVRVVGVNPTKAELEKLYNTTIENDPVYVSEIGDDNHKVQQVRLDFIIKVDDKKNPDIDFLSKVSLFLRKEYRKGSNSGKYQIIDKYGRTAWATEEEVKNKTIPQYNNGPANIDKDYRPAISGEEDLVKFLIAYLGIPACQKYIDGKWVMNDPSTLSDSEASLEHIQDYFKGDVSELRNIINIQPNNKVKVCFGVRKNDEGRMFQTVYTRMFLKNVITDYSKLDKDIRTTQANGALSTTEFSCDDLHEYTVESTDFNEQPAGDMPFGGSTPW